MRKKCLIYFSLKWQNELRLIERFLGFYATVVMKASKRKCRIIAPFDFNTVEEIDDGNGNNRIILKKAAKFGSKYISIVVSAGRGAARIEM